ncbi:Crp/Fnr family transcriptional regulator [Altererythrobacter sp. B11]|uniref:Crp/Fnr family transcriptional regulator n=1 Tax=Altererythrobacter sp. B11 TaxID=2060312 RepID=UPI000E5BDDBA|nr:Crp/Fnr family transcriptional regulator [Altererythrobacter sp. B11]
MNSCEHCTVRDKAVCRSLNAEDMERLGRMGRHQKLSRGQVLQWEGDESLLIGNVIEGVVKLSASTRQGKDQTLGIAYPGDFIGRPFGARSAQTVTALSEARVCTFRRADFDEFARTHPELEHDMLRRTLDELDHLRSWMLLLGHKSAQSKVASFLLEMAHRLGEPTSDGAGVAFTLPFGRQEIAEVLGMTIETVSRQITQLRNDRLVETPGQRDIVIRDRATLQDLAEME